MSTELDLTGFENEDDLAGRDYVKAGSYHVAVTVANEQPMDFNRKNYMDGVEFSFQILAGTDASQVGKQFDELFFNYRKGEDNAEFYRKRQSKLALSLGIVNVSQMGKVVSVNWQDAVARQCVVEIEEREFTTKTGGKGKGSRIASLGIYRVNDPHVAGVPKDDEALLLMAGLLPPAGAAPTNGSAPASQSPATTATPAADPLAGLKL